MILMYPRQLNELRRTDNIQGDRDDARVITAI